MKTLCYFTAMIVGICALICAILDYDLNTVMQLVILSALFRIEAEVYGNK